GGGGAEIESDDGFLHDGGEPIIPNVPCVQAYGPLLACVQTRDMTEVDHMLAPHATNGLDPERLRLKEQAQGLRNWQTWGPYLSDRQWGTVREDYSADGEAWSHVTYEKACSQAYRWGEDGLAGFCDSTQRLCLALALWNGADPILKERLFGLSGPEGSHGEDVKEL